MYQFRCLEKGLPRVLRINTIKPLKIERNFLTDEVNLLLKYCSVA